MTPFASARSYGLAGRSGDAAWRRAGQSDAEAPPLVARPVGRRPVALADLEDRDVVATVAQVGRHDLEQAAGQALAHDRVLARQRVGHHDRPPGRSLVWFVVERAVVVPPEALDHLGRDQGGGHDFGQPGPDQGLADLRPERQRIGAPGRHRGVGGDARDEVVAVDPDDLLGDVRLDDEVATPGGDGRVDDRLVASRVDLERLRARRRPGPASRSRPASSRSRPGSAARAAHRRRSRSRAGG